jgi:hypothetical protein
MDFTTAIQLAVIADLALVLVIARCCGINQLGDD